MYICHRSDKLTHFIDLPLAFHQFYILCIVNWYWITPIYKWWVYKYVLFDFIYINLNGFALLLFEIFQSWPFLMALISLNWIQCGSFHKKNKKYTHTYTANIQYRVKHHWKFNLMRLINRKTFFFHFRPRISLLVILFNVVILQMVLNVRCMDIGYDVSNRYFSTWLELLKFYDRIPRKHSIKFIRAKWNAIS